MHIIIISKGLGNFKNQRFLKFPQMKNCHLSVSFNMLNERDTQEESAV